MAGAGSGNADVSGLTPAQQAVVSGQVSEEAYLTGQGSVPSVVTPAPSDGGAGGGGAAGGGGSSVGVGSGSGSQPTLPVPGATPEITLAAQGFQKAGMSPQELTDWINSANARAETGMGAGLGVPQTDIAAPPAVVNEPAGSGIVPPASTSPITTSNKAPSGTSISATSGSDKYLVQVPGQLPQYMNLSQLRSNNLIDMNAADIAVLQNQMKVQQQQGEFALSQATQDKIIDLVGGQQLVRDTGGTMTIADAIATVHAFRTNPADPQFLQDPKVAQTVANLGVLNQAQYDTFQQAYNAYQQQGTVIVGINQANPGYHDDKGNWVEGTVRVDAAWVKELQKNDPAGYDTLMRQGLDGYNAYRTQFLKQYDVGGGSFDVHQAVLDTENELSLNFLRSIFGDKVINDTASAIRQAAQKLGVADPTKMTQAEVQEKISNSSDAGIAQTMVIAGVPYGIVQAAYLSLLAGWEATVLPRLSSKLQNEYATAKSSNDYTEFNADFNSLLTAQQVISTFMSSHNINPDDPQAITQAMSQGLDANAAIRAGYDEATIRVIDNQLKAQQTMTGYGFLPSGVAGPPEKGKTYSVDDLASYVRTNPDTGLQTVKDFFGLDGDAVAKQVQDYNDALLASASKLQSTYLGDIKLSEFSPQGIAFDDAIHNAGLQGTVFPDAVPKFIRTSDGGTTVWYDQSGKVLSGKDVQQSQWDNMTQEQRLKVASLWDADYNKNSYFAEMNKLLGEAQQEGGIAGQLLFSPITPITNPIAKQMTLSDAKVQLSKDYGSVTQALQNIHKEYVNTDGTYNTKRITDDMNANSSFRDQVLTATGYANAGDLKSSLDYYNQAQKVSAKEWAMAGLVGIADILGLAELGGVNVAGLLAKGAQNIGTGLADAVGLPLGTGARAIANLANGVRLAANALPSATGYGIAGLQAPDVVAALANPSVDTGQKILAGGGEAALILLPLVGPAIRAGQFSRIAFRDDYVPMRSMASEASTARVPFTADQLARIKAAGFSDTDIINAGTDINMQLASGVKTASVKLGDITVEVENIPYQRAVGGLSLFNSTPDGSLLSRGGAESTPLNKEFYTAAKVAIEPLERSYLTGMKATDPTINEIRIDDPSLIKDIMPQQRLISGGATIEPEAVLPSLDQLNGMGYRVVPIPREEGGWGVTFDANLGKINIRRYTLVKVTDNPTGLVRVRVGGSGDGGVVAIGDIHATTNYRSVFNDINSSFKDPVISGDPNNPATWHWSSSTDKGRTAVFMGDSIDRGPSYQLWRDTINRLHDEAAVAGDSVQRLIGNHELAYLSNDAIKGIEYTDAERVAIRQSLLDDINSGRVRAAASADGRLYTHAGVSTGVFPEYKGKSADFIANDLNSKVLRAIKNDNYDNKIFAKGRVERGNSLSRNEKSQGGIFWLRPQEAKASQIDLGFEQVVGHNPGFGVRRIWGDNFIETDVGRRTGGVGVYTDTPYVRTTSSDIATSSLGGKAPNLSSRVMISLGLKAMRDSIADVFLGWDGRIQAFDKIRDSAEAADKMSKDLDRQILEREKAGDSVGVRFLSRQKEELTSPSGRDYLYGGIGMWRDLVMGRQNSVKILDDADIMTRTEFMRIPVITQINTVRNQITQMSDRDVQNLFGVSRPYVLSALDTSKINPNSATYRTDVIARLENLRDVVDAGLGRSVRNLLDRGNLARTYAQDLQREYTRLDTDRTPYDITYADRQPRSPDREAVEESYREAQQVERTTRTPQERAPYESVRTPYERTLRDIRVPTERIPNLRTPPTYDTPPYPPYPTYPPRPPYSPRPPYVGETPPPPPPPPIPAVFIRMSKDSVHSRQHLPPGSITFAQGELPKGPIWKFVPPELQRQSGSGSVKPITLFSPPVGAKNSKSRSPYDTIQVIGGVPIAADKLTIRMGVQRITVTKEGNGISFENIGAEPKASAGVNRAITASPAGLLVEDGSIVFASGQKAAGVGQGMQQYWYKITPQMVADADGGVITPQLVPGTPHGIVDTGDTDINNTVQVLGRSRTAPTLPNTIQVEIDGQVYTLSMAGGQPVFSAPAEQQMSRKGQMMEEGVLLDEFAGGGLAGLEPIQPRQGVNVPGRSKKVPTNRTAPVPTILGGTE